MSISVAAPRLRYGIDGCLHWHHSDLAFYCHYSGVGGANRLPPFKENVWVGDEKIATDLAKLFKIIKRSGYRGYLPLETLGKGDPFKKVPVLLQNVRDALSIAESS